MSILNCSPCIVCILYCANWIFKIVFSNLQFAICNMQLAQFAFSNLHFPFCIVHFHMQFSVVPGHKGKHFYFLETSLHQMTFFILWKIWTRWKQFLYDIFFSFTSIATLLHIFRTYWFDATHINTTYCLYQPHCYHQFWTFHSEGREYQGEEFQKEWVEELLGSHLLLQLL